MDETQGVTVEEITTKCLGPLGVALMDNLRLEKKIAALTETIRQLTANEAGLVEHIQALEEEIERWETGPK